MYPKTRRKHPNSTPVPRSSLARRKMGFMKGKKKAPQDAPYIHAGNAAAYTAAQVEKVPAGRGGFIRSSFNGYSSLNQRAKHPALSTAADHGMRYGTEMVGTFFLLLVGTQVGTLTASLTLAALIFMGASISKAHVREQLGADVPRYIAPYLLAAGGALLTQSCVVEKSASARLPVHSSIQF